MTNTVIFYINEYEKNSEETKNIVSLLKQTKTPFDVVVVQDDSKWWKIKLDYLMTISVMKGIRIKQTRRTKSPYAQLVLFNDNKPIAFYPQERKGGQEITIEEFLKAFTKGKILSLFEL